MAVSKFGTPKQDEVSKTGFSGLPLPEFMKNRLRPKVSLDVYINAWNEYRRITKKMMTFKEYVRMLPETRQREVLQLLKEKND